MKLGRKTVNGSGKVEIRNILQVECCDKYVAKCKITSQKNLCLYSVTIYGLMTGKSHLKTFSLKISPAFSELVCHYLCMLHNCSWKANFMLCRMGTFSKIAFYSFLKIGFYFLVIVEL